MKLLLIVSVLGSFFLVNYGYAENKPLAVSGTTSFITLSTIKPAKKAVILDTRINEILLNFESEANGANAKIEVDLTPAAISTGEMLPILSSAAISYTASDTLSLMIGRTALPYGQIYNPMTYLGMYVEDQPYGEVNPVYQFSVGFKNKSVTNEITLFKLGDENNILNKNLGLANRMTLNTAIPIVPMLSILLTHDKTQQKNFFGGSLALTYTADPLEAAIEILAGKTTEDQDTLTVETGLTYGLDSQSKLALAVGYNKTGKTTKAMHMDLGYTFTLTEKLTMEDNFRLNQDLESKEQFLENYFGFNYAL